MSYLSRLKHKSENTQRTTLQNLQNSRSISFDGFDGSSPKVFPQIQRSPVPEEQREWVIHFSESEPLACVYCPPASHSEVQADHPGFVAAVPAEPVMPPKPAAMLIVQETLVYSWLKSINETDRDVIGDILECCDNDQTARDYFLCRAGSSSQYQDFNFITCRQCSNLVGRRCQAARSGEIVADKLYEPNQGWNRRCEGFKPLRNDIDQRTGKQRGWAESWNPP